MSLILFKLILPPIVILCASLAVRKWGDAVGGWVTGLPVTSGPVAFFLAVEYGNEFAALASDGSLIGTASQALFSLGYILFARWGWSAALLGATIIYMSSALLIQSIALPHWGYYILALIMLTVAAKCIPKQICPPHTAIASKWDLPARMATATTIVITLTAIASFVGAQIAGMLACFPIFGMILTVFAHRSSGSAMATQVLRGMVLSLYGFATFFLIIGLTIVKMGIGWSFLLATLSSLLIQGIALYIIRRR